MFNLFYVESPLQLLSAISAQEKFNDHKAVLIVNIGFSDRQENNRQIFQLIGDEWDSVHIIRLKRNRISNFISFVKNITFLTFKYRGRVDKYFFGEYRNVDMAILGALILPEDSVLLDDGSFTITAQNYYIKNGVSPYQNSKKKRFFSFFVGDVATPNLYSFFDLDLICGQVNYFSMEEKRTVRVDHGVVYFFGSKLSESGAILLIKEMFILTCIFESYKNYKVYYLPHRDESTQKLDIISKIGYEIKEIGKPAEVYFDETEVMPEFVFSYYSTVLYTCYKRFENVKLKSVDVIKYLLKDSDKVNAKEIYDYYKNLGMGFISIDHERF